MKRLFEIVNVKGQRKYIFLKDLYGHNRINIGINPKYNYASVVHIAAMEFRMLCEDSRFDQNAFFHSDRFLFNSLAPEDLSLVEQQYYREDLGITEPMFEKLN